MNWHVDKDHMMYIRNIQERYIRKYKNRLKKQLMGCRLKNKKKIKKKRYTKQQMLFFTAKNYEIPQVTTNCFDLSIRRTSYT